MQALKQQQVIQTGVSAKQTRTFAFVLTLGAAALLSMLPASAAAKVSVASIFGSHMVLQQEMAVPVWGTADAGEEVTVSFDGQSVKTKAGEDGKWMVKLASLKATKDQQGQVLTVAGSNTITFEDVLIGEVWLCSGQSNMAWNVSNANNAKEEIASANYPQIRFLNVPGNQTAREPLDNVALRWVACEPGTASSFSATGYYFGRKLHEDLGVPVGLMRSAVGGSVAQAWVGREALAKHMPEYDHAYAEMVMPGHLLEQRLAEFEKLRETYRQALEQAVEVEADAKAAAHHASVDLDDSDWQTMAVPGAWKIKGIASYDGIVWYRKTVEVPADWAGKDLLLKLGKIYNVDATWFNGQQVGSTGSWAGNNHNERDVEREYRVPGNLVKTGANVIAVRVGSHRRGGRFVGNPKSTFKLQLAEAANADVISLAGDWRALPVFQLPEVPSSPENHRRPTVLFNGMIHPLIPYAMRGAIWYQGESNASSSGTYQRLLTTLITDWRTRWGQGDFDFLIVQLPNYRNSSVTPRDEPWVMLREAQADVARTVPNTGLAVTLDIGEAKDIHPKNKQDVGKRLALVAEAQTYRMDVIHSGPTFKSFQVKGSEVIVSFDHIHGGLVQKGDKLDGFGLQGEDGEWVWADARIQGDQVIVSSDTIKTPTGVCYGWTSNPPSTFYNKAGLPAAQFKHVVK